MKNGNQWIVVRRFDDGSLAVRRAKHPDTGKMLTLSAAYVAAHVELAYATTAHRAEATPSTSPTPSSARRWPARCCTWP